MLQNRKRQQAISLFESGDYCGAFHSFVDLYHESEEQIERDLIFQILWGSYYEPNEGELRSNYEHNLKQLKAYPYFWNKKFHKFDELSFQLFPVSDEHYYCYSKAKDCFFGLYDGKTRHQMRYFFENLDEPLRVEDEDNLYNLIFLNDNVRTSEDFAGDNHIYLLYTSLEPLERLMLTSDLAPILEKQKFVFLVGEKNWNRYPINFKKKYNINYQNLTPAPLQIEEINRIYLNQCYNYSGTDFFEGVLNGSNHVLVINGWFFYESPKEIVDTVLEYIRHPNRKINVQEFLNAIQKHMEDVKFQCWPYMTQLLPDILKGRETAAVHELWKAVMIAAMLVSEASEGKKYYSRISPVIFFDPHGGPCSDYYELVRYFKYPAIEATVREPITRLMRFVSVFGYSNSPEEIVDTVTSTYTHSENIPRWLTDSGFYVAKLEDLKRKPEQTLRCVCRTLNIPYTEKLLDGRIGMWGVLFTNEKGEQLIGFDQRSVNRDISDMVSGDDMKRLNLYYQPILHYFRYPCTEADQRLSREEAEKLFSRPFEFERIYAAKRRAYMERLKSVKPEERDDWQRYIDARYKILPEDARLRIQAAMIETYLKGLHNGLALPEVMFPEETQAQITQAQRLREALHE